MSWLVAALKKRAQSVAAAEQPFLVGDTSFECVPCSHWVRFRDIGIEWNMMHPCFQRHMIALWCSAWSCFDVYWCYWCGILSGELRYTILGVVKSVMRTSEVLWPSSTTRAAESLFVISSGSSEVMANSCSGVTLLPSPQPNSAAVVRIDRC